MPNRNRGKKSSDDKIFAPKWWPVFKEAVDDYCFLLSRGYTDHSITQMVGNRYRLNARQRIAIQRMSASEQQVATRSASQCTMEDLVGRPLFIDGFNLLILLESALSGGFIFQGRDGTYRDLSSVHGSYKRVTKTTEAILMVGQVLKAAKVSSVKWYFDQPVSNSGRLKTLLGELAATHQFNWEVELAFNPDKELIKENGIIVTSDSWVLDQVKQWSNLGAEIIKERIPEVNLIAV